MTCGCGKPHERHDNASNITYEDLEKAAQAAGLAPQEALANMDASFEKA
jgi:hypothetical protein